MDLKRKVTDSYCRNRAIQVFCEYFSIYRSKKYYKPDNQEKWLFSDHYLTDTNIQDHLSGLDLYSYLLTKSTDIFSLEIDLHNEKLTKKQKLLRRFERYQYIVKYFGLPSLIFQSSQSMGLHCYYKINRKIFYQVLHSQVLNKLEISKSELNKLGIEILPTPTHALRLPYALKEGGAILDYDLKYMFPPTKENIPKLIQAIVNSNTYQYDDLFDSDFIKIDQKTRSKQFQNFTKTNRLSEYEKIILPELMQGNTNQAIEKLAFNCFINGLNVDQTFYRLNDLLENADLIRKKNTQEKLLKVRINNHFKRFERNKITFQNKKPEKVDFTKQVDLYQNETVNKLLKIICENQNIKHKLQIKSIKNFLNKLYIWKHYIDNISLDDAQIMTYRYNYFYHNVKTRGLYPLPYALLTKWTDRNNITKMIKRLEHEGILKLEQNKGSHIKICRYYSIDFNKNPLQIIIHKKPTLDFESIHINKSNMCEYVYELHLTNNKKLLEKLLDSDISKGMKYYLKCFYSMLKYDFKICSGKISCLRAYNTWNLINWIIDKREYEGYMEIINHNYLVKSFVKYVIKTIG